MCVGDAAEILAHSDEQAAAIYCHTEKKKIQQEINLSHAININDVSSPSQTTPDKIPSMLVKRSCQKKSSLNKVIRLKPSGSVRIICKQVFHGLDNNSISNLSKAC